MIKVAPYQPEVFLEISLKLFDTNSSNMRIYADLAEAVLKIPPEVASRWAERAVIWLRQQSYLFLSLPENLGELITYLARKDQIDVAINLTQELLAMLPQSDSLSIRKASTRLDEYDYGEIIKNHIVALAEEKPNTVLDLFCDFLDQYLKLSYSIREQKILEDYSSSWFYTPEDMSANLHGISGILVGAIWSVSLQILERDPNQVRELFHKFQRCRWRIFDRISLYLLRRFPKQLLDFIVDRLVNRDRLEWLGLYSEGMGLYYSHEHALLLKEQFQNLPDSAQKQIFSYLTKEPVDITKIAPERQDEYIKYWRRDWLSIICDYLPPNLKQLYNQLVQELGAANSLDSIFDSKGSAVLSGPNSPKSGAELAEMVKGDMNALFTFLQEWKPSGRSPEASKNGLAWELAEQVIAFNPQQFVSQIERFKELEPLFMVWLLRGLKKALESPTEEYLTFSWEPVFVFCKWMLENLRDINKNSISEGYSEWSRICDAIVEIIDAGFLAKGESSIPITLREQVWQLLEPITIDPLVTPGFTSQYESGNMGSYGASINAVRGKAMYAVVRYAFWSRQTANGNSEASQTLDDMPEVQQVLEWHLKPQQDPSPVIRAAYGKAFPSLLHLAPGWTLQRIDHIFPEEPSLQQLFEAAWEGYLFNQLCIDAFNALRRKYIYAIEQLSTLNTVSHKQSETSRALPSHLLHLFWYKLIDLDEPDNLLENFFAKAPNYLREEFMRQFSWRLLYGDFRVDDELCQRLQNFLEWRIEQAKMFAMGVDYSSDLRYFSWIIASGKLNEQWAIAKLLDVLKIRGTIDPCREFLKRLESLAHANPKDIVQCLCHIAGSSKAAEWFASYYANHYYAIFQVALESENEVTQKLTRELINRLLVWNLGDYRKLLL